jgi:glycosyltransferase involved in cell wall biosynthesis
VPEFETQESPTITVVMAVFNCAAYVEEAVASVCRQSEGDFELVVVNDGSTDQTRQIVANLAKAEPRIRLSSQVRAGKPSVARNAAIRQGRGEFVSFLDGDDLYHPDKLRWELDVFRSHPEVDLVFADLQKFSDTPDPLRDHGWLAQDRFLSRAQQFLRPQGDGVYLATPGFYRFMSAELTGVNTQTVMIRRSVLEAEPYWFNEEILVGEDADLFFRLASRHRVAFVDEVLAYYRQRPDSLTQQRRERLQSEIRVYTDNLERAKPVLSHDELVRARRKVSVRYEDLGYLHYAAWEMSAARRAYLKAIRLEPQFHRRLGMGAALIKTWAPARVIEWARSRRQAAASEVT